jgi:hypothetical protein
LSEGGECDSIKYSLLAKHSWSHAPVPERPNTSTVPLVSTISALESSNAVEASCRVIEVGEYLHDGLRKFQWRVAKGSNRMCSPVQSHILSRHHYRPSPEARGQSRLTASALRIIDQIHRSDTSLCFATYQTSKLPSLLSVQRIRWPDFCSGYVS